MCQKQTLILPMCRPASTPRPLPCSAAERIEPVFLFDLDGTLVDSVYQHVLAWKEALDAEGIELSVWRIHRKIGMSEGLFAIRHCTVSSSKRYSDLRLSGEA